MIKEILMLYVTAVTYISFVPQIVKLYRTKKSEDLSLISWFLWVSVTSASLLYGLLDDSISYIIATASELALTLIILILSLKYRKG